jgi:hypothetical protein
MKRTFSQALRIFFSPETIVPFLLGSVCLSVLGNSVYDILKNTFGTTTPELSKVAIGAFFILGAAIILVSLIIARRLAALRVDTPFEVSQKALDRLYPGLILLVSRVESCQTAIAFHQKVLKRCWLICSNQSQSLEAAQELRRLYPDVCVDDPIVVQDVYDPLTFRDNIDSIYRRRLPNGWQETDVITDYTGMTAHASVGAVLACLKTNRPLQYTPAKVDANGKIIGSLDPIKVILDQPLTTMENEEKRVQLQKKLRWRFPFWA